MITLKLTIRELAHLSTFFQACINIARIEMRKGVDCELYILDAKNYAIKEVLWPSSNPQKTTMNIAYRNASINEFEKAQWDIIKASKRKIKSKERSVSLSLMAGYLFVDYMQRVLAIEKDQQLHATVQIHSHTILQKLI